MMKSTNTEAYKRGHRHGSCAPTHYINLKKEYANYQNAETLIAEYERGFADGKQGKSALYENDGQ